MPTLYKEPLPDGRIRYRLRYRDPRTGKAHTVSCIKPNGSKQNYNAALRELQDRVLFLYSDHLSIKKAADLYLDEKARILRPQSLNRTRIELGVVNRALGEDLLLEKLDALTLRSALLRLSQKNSTFNERLVRYKAFLNWCWQNGLISERWHDRIQPLPDNRRDRIREKYLEPDELRALLEGIRVPAWYFLAYFLCLSGLRVGEALALTLDDLGEYISVTKNFAINLQQIGPPKTAESDRLVYIQPELRDLLDEYLAFRSVMLADNGRQSNILFCTPAGEYSSYYAFNKYLKEISLRVLGRRITPHALRHTSASFLIASGVPLDSISRRLGHTNSRITKEIYVHQTQRLQQLDDSYVREAKLL